MKNIYQILLGCLLVGSSVCALADKKPPKAPPPPPQFALATGFIHGGSSQATGQCGLFNAGDTPVTIVDLHAEDGNGNVIAMTSTTPCANINLEGKRACTVNFKFDPTSSAGGGAVCLGTVSVSQSTNPSKSDSKQSPSNSLAAGVLPVRVALEISDVNGNVIGRSEGSANPMPTSTKPGNSGGKDGNDD
jgi:hypothetical protein